jgi:hypothetical protein
MSSSTQFHLSDSMQRGIERGMRVGMESAMNNVVEEVVNKLSDKFEFDAKEALEFLGVVSMSKPKKPRAIQLPWCGMVIPQCCQALKVNKGLHSQCLNDKEDGGKFCKRCQKDADKNGGVPKNGTAQERADNPDYVDAKGKAPVNYGNYMKKEGITREAAEAEAAKYGLTIPEEQFVVVQTKKGRKSKKDGNASSDAESVSSSDTESVSSSDADTEQVSDVESVSSSDAEADTAKKSTGSRKPAEFEGDTEEWKAMSAEEQKAWKDEKKAEKDAKKAAEKAEKDAKKAAEKAEKDAKKAAEKAEKDAKKAEEKAEKDAKKAAEKAAKDAKKAAEKAEKAAKKAAEKKAKEAAKAQAASASEAESSDEE